MFSGDEFYDDDVTSGLQPICRVHLCNRQAVPNSNLCDAHYRQIVDKALTGPLLCSVCGGVVRTWEDGSHPVHAWYSTTDHRAAITESEARALDGNR